MTHHHKLTLVSLSALLILVYLLAGCGALGDSSAEKANEGEIVLVDSIGREIRLKGPAQRAIVENAYNAELITAIDAIGQVAGVDYYIYQDQEGFGHRFTEEMLIGKGKGEINYEKVLSLKPDVFITTGNSMWSTIEEKLRPFGIPVVIIDAYYTDQFADNARRMGQIFGREKEAQAFSDYFLSKLSYIQTQLKDVPKKRVYFEYRTAGKTTIPGDYFYHMMNFAHAENIFQDAKNVQVDLESVALRNPAYVVKVSDANVFSSYIPPTAEDMQRIHDEIVSRPGWENIEAVKKDNILLLSHYVHGGASKLVGTMYIAKFLYPDALTALDPEAIWQTWVEKYQKRPYIAGHTWPSFATGTSVAP